MIKWTNERIAGAREEVRDLGIFALEYAKPTDTFGVTMVLALAEIGLRVVDPSPEDVERVAGAICKSGKFETGQGTCAVRCMDQLGEARKGPCRHAFKVHNDLARAALAAIAEVEE